MSYLHFEQLQNRIDLGAMADASSRYRPAAQLDRQGIAARQVLHVPAGHDEQGDLLLQEPADCIHGTADALRLGDNHGPRQFADGSVALEGLPRRPGAVRFLGLRCVHS